MNENKIERLDEPYDHDHIHYDFFCLCPKCKYLMNEAGNLLWCVQCGTVINKDTKEID